MEFFEDKVREKSKSIELDSQIELVTNFFSRYSDEKDLDYYKSMVVDLYRAITCFRIYESIEEFMRINPELEESRSDIEELWLEFERLSPEDLADVALELLRDI